MSQTPRVSKDKNGNWTITGVEERNTSQTQADYEDIVKGAQQAPGQDGFNAVQMLKTNPQMSSGLVTALSRNGAVPQNKLVTAMAQIDAATRAQRELDAQKEAQRVSTEKFNNTIRGKFWSAFKGTTRTAFLAPQAIFEGIGNLSRGLAQGLGRAGDEIQAIKDGEVDWLTEQPTNPNLTRKDLGLAEPDELLEVFNPMNSIRQTTLYQAVKQYVDTGRIDLGSGFSASEEIGAGFLAREEQKKIAKVTFTVDGEKYERPFSAFDPITYIYTGGDLESDKARLITAIGDLGIMIASDPFLAVSKIKKARDVAALATQTSKGLDSAKNLQKLAFLDSQLDENVAAVRKAYEDIKFAPAASKAEKQKVFQNLLDEQLKIADEADNLVYSPKAIADYLNSPKGIAIFDVLADMNFKEIYSIGKTRGRQGGFTVAQSKALAAATTREEAMAALAPFISQGTVVANVLEEGTKLGRGVTNAATVLGSKISPVMTKVTAGKNIALASAITGRAASAYAKMPWASKMVEEYNRSLNTVIGNGKFVHSEDVDNLVNTVINYGNAARLTPEVIDDLVTTIVNADDLGNAGYTASAKLFDEILRANIDKKFIDKEKLAEITRVFENGRTEMGNYWTQRHVVGAKLDYILVGGKKVTISGPHLDSELLNSSVYFPPLNDVLNTISVANRYLRLGKIKDPLDWFSNNLWKKMVLVRPAYVIRNIAEEQIRVLASGHISFFNSPLTAMGMWLGRETSSNPVRRLLSTLDPYKHTVTDEAFKLGNTADEFAMEVAANDVAGDYLRMIQNQNVSSFDSDLNKVTTLRGFDVRAYGHPRWWEGLANEIRILRESSAGRVVAGTKPGEEAAAINYLLRGKGKPEWEKFVMSQPADSRTFWRSEEGLRAYLFSGKNAEGADVSVAMRIFQVAGREGISSSAIRSLISTGKFEVNGVSLIVPTSLDTAANSLKNADAISKTGRTVKDMNEEFAEKLREAFDGQGDWDGILYKIPKRETVFKGRENPFNSIPRWFFNTSVKFEKQSTMGPEWRQSYWDAIRSVAPSLDADAIPALRSAAEKSLSPLRSWDGRPIGKKNQVWDALGAAKGKGNLTAEEAHQYASTIASKRVADLFYDASRKRLLAHQVRLIAPFAQAWGNTIGAWTKLAANNPYEIYKISKGLTWLTNPASSSIYSATDAKDFYDPNQGFFYSDPESGERRFFVPFMSTGLNFLSNVVGMKGLSTQGPVAFSTTPQSFNFAFASGSIMPGFGPGMTIPITLLDKLGFNPVNLLSPLMRDRVNKVLFPFGEPDVAQGAIEGIFLTPNYKRLLAPFGPEAGYAAAFAPTLNYLATGGDYDLDSPEDQQRLLKDADRFAKTFTFFRGAFGFASPFPLTMEALTTKDDGSTALSASLYKDFRDLELASGGDKNKAYADFLDLYGPNYIFAIIGYSSGTPTNLFSYELLRDNPDVADKYADTYGYIYPGGGLSQEMMRWEKKRGNRKYLTKDEIIEKVTRIRYFAAKDRLMTRSAVEGFSKDQYDEALSNLSASYAARGLSITTDYFKDARIKSQLNAILKDERFLDSDAVQGLRDYMYLRNVALQAAGRDLDSTLAVKGAEQQRIWLAGEATRILERNPEFQKFFYAFFKSELEG
jgi:hypothetical protein